MTQVYCIVQNQDGTQTLISKKREENSFWERRVDNKVSIVNQAGQFASLAGGKMEEKEVRNPRLTAARELAEECGIDISAYKPLSTTTKHFKDGKYEYYLITYTVSNANFTELERIISINLQPSNNMAQPSGLNIKDWELQSVISVKTNELSQYLGVKQPAKVDVSVAKAYSQDIIWYAVIAKHVVETYQARILAQSNFASSSHDQSNSQSSNQYDFLSPHNYPSHTGSSIASSFGQSSNSSSSSYSSSSSNDVSASSSPSQPSTSKNESVTTEVPKSRISRWGPAISNSLSESAPLTMTHSSSSGLDSQEIDSSSSSASSVDVSSSNIQPNSNLRKRRLDVMPESSPTSSNSSANLHSSSNASSSTDAYTSSLSNPVTSIPPSDTASTSSTPSSLVLASIEDKKPDSEKKKPKIVFDDHPDVSSQKNPQPPPPPGPSGGMSSSSSATAASNSMLESSKASSQPQSNISSNSQQSGNKKSLSLYNNIKTILKIKKVDGNNIYHSKTNDIELISVSTWKHRIKIDNNIDLSKTEHKEAEESKTTESAAASIERTSNNRGLKGIIEKMKPLIISSEEKSDQTDVQDKRSELHKRKVENANSASSR